MQGVKKRDIETQSQDDSIEKGNIGKILNKKKNMKKESIRKIFSQTRSKNAVDPLYLSQRVGYQFNQKLQHHYQH